MDELVSIDTTAVLDWQPRETSVLGRWLEHSLWAFSPAEIEVLEKADAALAHEGVKLDCGASTLLAAKQHLHANGTSIATAPKEVGGFLAGYRDLNLRDAAHLGHAELMAAGSGPVDPGRASQRSSR